MLPLVLCWSGCCGDHRESELTTEKARSALLARLGSRTGQIEADEAAMIGKGVPAQRPDGPRPLMVPRVSAPTLSG